MDPKQEFWRFSGVKMPEDINALEDKLDAKCSELKAWPRLAISYNNRGGVLVVLTYSKWEKKNLAK